MSKAPRGPLDGDQLRLDYQDLATRTGKLEEAYAAVDAAREEEATAKARLKRAQADVEHAQWRVETLARRLRPPARKEGE